MSKYERTYSFHECIDLVDLAKDYTKTTFFLVSLPDTRLPMAFSTRWKKTSHVVTKIVAHFIMVMNILRLRSKYQVIFVRDFLTVPMAMVAWILWPFRKQVLFINVHNFQRAMVRSTDRISFQFMAALGFRFAFLESSEGIELLIKNPNPMQFVEFPHVMISNLSQANKFGPKKQVVGFVGVCRPEKGFDKTIKVLHALKKEKEIEVVIGTKTSSLTRDVLDMIGDIKILDTTSPEGYASALQYCDVVLLNYKKEDYYYRGSGVVTNAIECGASVVCPDYPVFRKQIYSPKPIGTTYHSEDEIIVAVKATLNDRPMFYANILEYIKERSPQAMAKRIDAFVVS